ncbi:MAG: aldo/keto reductase [Rhizobiales bacterium]|nr:aldo/keto reductase [Hyphomicrobiales bacterium]
MQYRILGRTGLRIAPLVLGTDNILNPTAENESIRMIHAAMDAGINMIDTADSYAAGESERVIGKALAEDGRRDKIILATKAHYPTGPGPNDYGNSRRHLIMACDASLRRLKTDWIDLFQLHRPSPEIHIEETLAALDHLVAQGKVRYIGTTTHPAWMVAEALGVSALKGFEKFVTEQPPYNLLDRRIENELLPMAEKHGLGVITWSPMAMGILAGRYGEAAGAADQSRAALRGGIYAERVTPRAIAVGAEFVALCQARGIDPAQGAVLWVKDQQGITAPLIGPKSVAQLENMLPVLDMVLEEDMRTACDALVPPGSVVADFHNSAPWMKMRVANV